MKIKVSLKSGDTRKRPNNREEKLLYALTNVPKNEIWNKCRIHANKFNRNVVSVYLMVKYRQAKYSQSAVVTPKKGRSTVSSKDLPKINFEVVPLKDNMFLLIPK